MSHTASTGATEASPTLAELLSAFSSAYADEQAARYAEHAYGFAVAELAGGHQDCAEAALSLLTDDRLIKAVTGACLLSGLAVEILRARGVEIRRS